MVVRTSPLSHTIQVRELICAFVVFTTRGVGERFGIIARVPDLAKLRCQTLSELSSAQTYATGDDAKTTVISDQSFGGSLDISRCSRSHPWSLLLVDTPIHTWQRKGGRIWQGTKKSGKKPGENTSTTVNTRKPEGNGGDFLIDVVCDAPAVLHHPSLAIYHFEALL